MWFREDTGAPRRPGRRVERSLLEVEGYVRDFAEDNPHVTVSLLRFSNVLGPDIVTPLSKALALPLVPSVLGFDPASSSCTRTTWSARSSSSSTPAAGHLQRRR